MEVPGDAPATVIIAQHGRSELTLDCIRSFRVWHGDGPRIVVVDDGSPPADVRAIARARLMNVELICRPRAGVTSAWSIGARAVTSPALVFLNNDATTHARWLDDLASPVLAGTAVTAGVELRTEQAVPEAVLRRLPTRRYAAGWCFAVRRDDFEAVGGFQRSLELYFSDTDLQARLLVQRGQGEEGIAVPIQERLRHLGHATTSRDPNRAARWRADRARFIELWRSAFNVRHASACRELSSDCARSNSCR